MMTMRIPSFKCLTVALAAVLLSVPTLAQVRYSFVPTDYVSTDNNRAPQSAFSYGDNSFTITASGKNNIAFKMGGNCDNKYFIAGEDHWFVVAGTGLSTGATDAYLWWINGVNHGTQVAPDYVVTDGDRQIFIRDADGGHAPR